MSIDNVGVGFWLVLGFLVGWIVEFVFDSIWLRRIERRYQDEMHDLSVELDQSESAVRGMRQEIDGLERQANSEQIRNEKLVRQLEDAERIKAELDETKANRMRLEADLHRTSIQSDNLNTLLVAAKSSASKSDETLTEVRTETELRARALGIANTRIEVLEDQLKIANSELEVLRGVSTQKNVDLRVLNAHAQEAERLRRMLAAKDQEIESYRQQIDGRESADVMVVSNPAALSDANILSEANGYNNLDVENNQVAIDATEKDDFVQIKGVGSKYASTLYENGILTFDLLAEQTPEYILEVINPQFWQVIDPAAWISEAAVLAQRKRKDSL